MTFKKILCILLVCMTILLSGCQDTPNGNIVTSKNDGSFEISKVQTATEPKTLSEKIELEKNFFSTDNTVEYFLDICTDIPQKALPIMEVAPYFLTGEDAQRVAKALFGDVEIYTSRQRQHNTVFSQEELRTKLHRWSQYANSEAVSKLFGYAPGDTVNIVQGFIEEYTVKMETAPLESQNKVCTWEYLSESSYSRSPEENGNGDDKKENQAIKTELVCNEIPYAYNVVRRDLDDFKMSRISAYPYDGFSPDNIDERIFHAQLCRTEEPTAEQIKDVQEKAKQILDEIQLGQWMIDQCYPEKKMFGDIPEYSIHVTAVPTLEGVEVIRRPQLRNLRSDAVFASNLYLTDAEFVFSAHGDLVYFELNTPLQFIELTNANVETLPMDSLIEKAIQHLELTDYTNYSLPAVDIMNFEDYYGEKLLCQVHIGEMRYGLTRIKVPNTDSSYYYVPALALYGTADYLGKNTGTVYFSDNDSLSPAGSVPLIMLNAVDGTVIELSNG